MITSRRRLAAARAQGGRRNRTGWPLALSFRRALRREELFLVYQPAVDMSTGATAGVEALVRWQHPTDGLLAPCDFLPAVSESTLATRFDLFVVECALRRATEWVASGLSIPVYVNISPRSLQVRSVPDAVGALLERSGLPPRLLKLELTELPGQDPALTKEVAQAFEAIGVDLILDDFGTGHSSLGRLLALPFESLKIDQRYVSALLADRRMEAIVRAIVDVGHALGVKVTAEGVESEAVWRRLQLLGCDRAQGFLISRPLRAEQLADWLASDRVRRIAATPARALVV
jgi:EAL domain-containing protein (putative c-di-GMP-specific phosphodiesterase class I)